jgi:hypothetical protein
MIKIKKNMVCVLLVFLGIQQTVFASVSRQAPDSQPTRIFFETDILNNRTSMSFGRASAFFDRRASTSLDRKASISFDNKYFFRPNPSYPSWRGVNWQECCITICPITKKAEKITVNVAGTEYRLPDTRSIFTKIVEDTNRMYDEQPQ